MQQVIRSLVFHVLCNAYDLFTSYLFFIWPYSEVYIFLNTPLFVQLSSYECTVNTNKSLLQSYADSQIH